MDANDGDVRNLFKSTHEGQVRRGGAAVERRLLRAVADEEDDDSRRASPVRVDDPPDGDRHGMSAPVVQL